MPATKYKFVKIPLQEHEKTPDYPIGFGSMPSLYLELLENKDKIKQDLINKNYVPSETEIRPPSLNFPKNSYDLSEKSNQSKPDNGKTLDLSSEEFINENVGHLREDKKDLNLSDEEFSESKSDNSDDSDIFKKYITRGSDGDNTDSGSIKYESESEEDNEHDLEKYDRASENSEQDSDRDSDQDSDKQLSAKLKDLLRDKPHGVPYVPKQAQFNAQENFHQPNQFHSPYDRFKRSQTVQPPTLQELQEKGEYNAKPEMMNSMHIGSSERAIEDNKRELLFKFDLLKKSYPEEEFSIPEYTIHSDFIEMQKSYDMAHRKLSLNSTVDSYKRYLNIGFAGTELVLGNFMGFDMAGFTQQQMSSMPNYERLLIELGEKSYIPEGSDWPVEVRLCGMILMNAAIFIVGKMIIKKTGANIMSGLGGVPTGRPKKSTKHRMKGPSIDIDNL